MYTNVVYLCVLQIFCLRMLPTGGAAETKDDSDAFSDPRPNGQPEVKDAFHLEPCPQDSVMYEDICKCYHELCEKPSCNYTLTQLKDATDIPGSCCPTYSCIGCPDEVKIEDKCPCAEGAVIDSFGKCSCIDPFKTVTEGKCVCDPNKCQLPHLCDPNSVAVKETDGGCCPVTKCIPCPEDSYPTTYDDHSVEDKCVCHPCPNKMCGDDQTPIIHKRGNNFPGSCCDLYSCDIIEDKICNISGTIYKENDTWSSDTGEQCRCEKGITLCGSVENTQMQKSCLSSDGNIYHHMTSWFEDEDCTNCTCLNGEIKCISHFCDIIENKVDSPSTEMQNLCSFKDAVYMHNTSWSIDPCTNCRCLNGEVQCVQMCPVPSNSSHADCPPLESCKKKCEYGLKTNKKGCEICKCKVPAGQTSKEDYPLLWPLLKNYNISENKIISLVKGLLTNTTKSENETYIFGSSTTSAPSSTTSEKSRLSEIFTTTTSSSAGSFPGDKYLEDTPDVTSEEKDVGDGGKIFMFFTGFAGGITLAFLFAVFRYICRTCKHQTSQNFTPCNYRPIDGIEMDKNKNIPNIYTQKNFEMNSVA